MNALKTRFSVQTRVVSIEFLHIYYYIFNEACQCGYYICLQNSESRLYNRVDELEMSNLNDSK